MEALLIHLHEKDFTQPTNILHFLSSFIPLSQLYSILQESYLKRQKHSGILLKNSTLKFFQSVKTLTWGWGWGQIITVWQMRFCAFQCDPLALMVWEFLTFTWCQVVHGQGWATWKQEVQHHPLQIQHNRINLVYRSLILLQNIHLCGMSEKLFTPSECDLSVQLFKVLV